MALSPRLYVDSAEVDAVGSLLADGLVFGVTTNPTILERGGRTVAELLELYARWTDEGAREVCFQTWGTDASDLRARADAILALGDRAVVKVPATPLGFPVAAALAAEGAPVLLTAVYSSAQALTAATLGIRYIAPYLGRLRDAGRDGLADIAQMQAVCAGSATNVLAASIRSPDDLVALALVGVPYVTAAPAVLRAALQHDTSDSAAAEFEAAVERMSSPVAAD